MNYVAEQEANALYDELKAELGSEDLLLKVKADVGGPLTFASPDTPGSGDDACDSPAEAPGPEEAAPSPEPDPEPRPEPEPVAAPAANPAVDEAVERCRS